MSMMADSSGPVTGGVDTHKDVHVAAVVDPLGAVLGTAAFDNSTPGYELLHRWLSGFGTLERVGVEGTGSYGAGLARFLTAADLEVVEINRPDRHARHREGKSDPLDAIAAARGASQAATRVCPRAATGSWNRSGCCERVDEERSGLARVSAGHPGVSRRFSTPHPREGVPGSAGGLVRHQPLRCHPIASVGRRPLAGTMRLSNEGKRHAGRQSCCVWSVGVRSTGPSAQGRGGGSCRWHRHRWRDHASGRCAVGSGAASVRPSTSVRLAHWRWPVAEWVPGHPHQYEPSG